MITDDKFELTYDKYFCVIIQERSRTKILSTAQVPNQPQDKSNRTATGNETTMPITSSHKLNLAIPKIVL